MNKYITGPYAVLLTPFDGRRVDKRIFREQIKWANDSRISGYVSNGSTGEFVLLSIEEQMQLTEIVAGERSKDKKLVAGACAANYADTLKLCEHAARFGAEASLVCPPYYFKYSMQEREAFYIAVADRSPIPIILYNIPFFTQELETELIYRLLEHKNIIGVKDSSANMKRLMHMAQVYENTPKSILTGTDDILLPALIGGCSGSFTALGVILPNEICELYEAVQKGDINRAKGIQYSLLSSIRRADSETFPKGYKRWMSEVSGMKFKDKEYCK